MKTSASLVRVHVRFCVCRRKGDVCIIPNSKEFFIATADHDEWGTAHSVWGKVRHTHTHTHTHTETQLGHCTLCVGMGEMCVTPTHTHAPKKCQHMSMHMRIHTRPKGAEPN